MFEVDLLDYNLKIIFFIYSTHFKKFHEVPLKIMSSLKYNALHRSQRESTFYQTKATILLGKYVLSFQNSTFGR